MAEHVVKVLLSQQAKRNISGSPVSTWSIVLVKIRYKDMHWKWWLGFLSLFLFFPAVRMTTKPQDMCVEHETKQKGLGEELLLITSLQVLIFIYYFNDVEMCLRCLGCVRAPGAFQGYLFRHFQLRTLYYWVVNQKNNSISHLCHCANTQEMTSS